MEQINIKVDQLAKKALIAAFMSGKFIDTNFPFEQVCVVVAGKKFTGDSPKKSFEHNWSTQSAWELSVERVL